MSYTAICHAFSQCFQINTHVSKLCAVNKTTWKLFFFNTGNMTMRWRGIAMRRMSMFPNADPAHLAITEDAIRSEMENGSCPLLGSCYTCWMDVHCGVWQLLCIIHDSSSKYSACLVFFCVTDEQNLVKELIALSTREQIRAIRELPMSFEEKKHIRYAESRSKKW